MATSAPQDIAIWNIVISCDDPTKVKGYQFPGDTDVDKIKAKWARDFGIGEDLVLLTTTTGTVLDSAQSLCRVDESYPDRKMVYLYAETAVDLEAEIYKGLRAQKKQISAFLRQHPEELHALICEAFGIDDERLFRLSLRKSPLKCNLTLRDQGAGANALVCVDLAFQLRVWDPWDDTVEEFLMYSSENCELLTKTKTEYPQRLMCGKRVLHTDGDLMDALTPLGLQNRSKLFLELHIVKSVFILTDKYFKERWTWPLDLIGSFFPKAPGSVRPSIMLEGDSLSASDPMCFANVPDHSLLHQGNISVRVKCSDGRYQVVRVSQLGTVADMEECVRATEKYGRFALRRGRCLLDRNETVEAVVKDGDALEVVRVGHRLTVTLSDRSVRWLTEENELRFTDLVHALAGRGGGLEYEQLFKKKLCCKGCGRLLTKKEEEFQPIPAPCCRLRSLWLIEPTGPDTAETGTQCAKRSTTVGSTATELKCTVSDAWTDELDENFPSLEAKAEHLLTEIGKLKSNLDTAQRWIEAQDAKIKALQKESADKARELSLRTRESEDQAAIISVLEESRVEAERARKEREGQLEAEETEAIAPPRAKTPEPDLRKVEDKADVVVDRRKRAGTLPRDFKKPEEGRREGRRPDVERLLPERERSRSFLSKWLRPPKPPATLLLYVRNLTQHRDGEDFTVQTAPPPPVLVGTIRGLVATAMNVDPQNVRLWRWNATGPDGDAFVRVCDAGGSPQWFDPEYGDAAGNFRRVATLRNQGERPLNFDTDPFLVVPGRINIVSVHDKA